MKSLIELRQQLYDRTIALAKKDKRTARQVAEGAGVGRHWYAKFRQGRAPHAETESLQKLFDFFSKPTKPQRRVAKVRAAVAERTEA